MTALARGWFYPGMALAIAAVVFAGFGPTYYLRSEALPPLPALTQVHGLAFTAWIVLLATQVGLVAAGRRNVHRRLGAAGGGLAAAMIILGVLVAFAAARRDIAAGRAQEALAFLIIPLGDIVMFAALVGLALYYRARPDFHKRYMLLATLALLPAAIGRIPWFTDPSGFVPVFALLLAAGPAYDFFTRGRPHPVLVYGGIAVFLSELGRFLSMQHPSWMAVATWLVG
jgi:hypothetical protein